MTPALKRTWGTAIRAWLPTLTAIGGVIVFFVVVGFRHEVGIAKNTEGVAENKTVVTALKQAQQKVKERLVAIQTVQQAHRRDLGRIERKLDKVLDRMLNGRRRGPVPTR